MTHPKRVAPVRLSTDKASTHVYVRPMIRIEEPDWKREIIAALFVLLLIALVIAICLAWAGLVRWHDALAAAARV